MRYRSAALTRFFFFKPQLECVNFNTVNYKKSNVKCEMSCVRTVCQQTVCNPCSSQRRRLGRQRKLSWTPIWRPFWFGQNPPNTGRRRSWNRPKLCCSQTLVRRNACDRTVVQQYCKSPCVLICITRREEINSVLQFVKSSRYCTNPNCRRTVLGSSSVPCNWIRTQPLGPRVFLAV